MIIQSRTYQIASDVFTATITFSGLLTGFVPIISFFFNGEIKEEQRQSEERLEAKITASEGEKQNLLKLKKNLSNMVYHNMRSGVLKYTELFIVVSAVSQFFLIEYYLFTDVETMMFLYEMFTVPILLILVIGILPIIRLALHMPALRFVQVTVKPAETEIRIEPEE